MPERHTVLRSMHDLGLAAWFGGSLMGAVGLGGATREFTDPHDKARARVGGWTAWGPVNAAAMGVHIIGATGLLIVNRRRAVAQAGVTANSIVKALLTVGALGTNVYSAKLGRQLAREGVMTEGTGVGAVALSPQAASAKQQLDALQWVTPTLTGGIVVLAAQQGEQQRASQMVGGLARRALHGGKAAKVVGTHPGATAKLAAAAEAAKLSAEHPVRTAKAAGKAAKGSGTVTAAFTAGKHPAKTGKLVAGAEAAKQAAQHPVEAAKLVSRGEAAKLATQHPVRSANLAKVLS